MRDGLGEAESEPLFAIVIAAQEQSMHGVFSISHKTRDIRLKVQIVAGAHCSPRGTRILLTWIGYLIAAASPR
jgi:hypothetical protein